MSNYFAYKCAGYDDVPTICAGWCKKDPILAVSTANHKLTLYKEEGDLYTSPISKAKADCVVIAWQPGTNVLCTGWSDGTLQLLSMKDKVPKEDKVVHHGVKLSFMVWNKDGSRLVTGDEDGTVAVWRVDSRGRLATICQYRKKGAQRKCVFINTLGTGDDADSGEPEIASFFFGGDNGVVCYADDMGHCSDVLGNLNSAIDVMEFYEEKSRLVIITRSLLMTQLQVMPDGRLSSLAHVKLSMKGDSGIRHVTWVAPGLLATSSQDEPLIRCWDLASDENYVLSLISGDPTVARTDRALSLAFNPIKSILSVGTLQGKVLMWRYHVRKGTSGGSAPSQNWEPMKSSHVEAPVRDVGWWGHGELLYCRLPKGVSVLNETTMQRKLTGNIAAIQEAPNKLCVEHGGGAVLHLTTSINIKGMDLSSSHVAVWNGSRVEVYEVGEVKLRNVAEFDLKTRSIVIFGDTMFATLESSVAVMTLQGATRSSIPFTEMEGEPMLLDNHGSFLAIATKKGALKVFDVSRTPPKPVGSGGRFEEGISGKSMGSIRSLRVNSTGTRISILADSMEGGVDTSLYVYNADIDSVAQHDVGGATRAPVSHCWDATEPKLLAVQTVKMRVASTTAASGPGGKDADPEDDDGAKSDAAEHASDGGLGGGGGGGGGGPGDGEEKDMAQEPEDEVLTLFSTIDGDIKLQDSFALEAPLDALLGVGVPRLYFVARVGVDSHASRVHTRPLRDFVGLEDADDQAKQALLDFSYYLSVGNMDEAYKAVKLIHNPTVWENMAHMCVKSKRLDVAEVCLGNMGHARGARAVRLSKKEPELEARVAMVGIQLGLLNDAARLYQSCGRYDLLNKLYQACGQWDRAVAIAKKHDRINLATTHFRYARHLEALGDTAKAMEQYELAGAQSTEIPRMLFDQRNYRELERYVETSRDKKLLTWWAQYCESIGQLDKAIEYYHEARDAVALVRVFCFKEDYEAAVGVVRETEDCAAAYHLARQLEAAGNVRNALQFFQMAGRFNHAVRIAKEAGFDGELIALALQSSPTVMLDAARYFEERGILDKAVQLYQKGGDIPKALDLCFKAQLFEDLRLIADDLGDGTSPEVLRQCADFFVEHGQFDKAASLLITAKRYPEALDMSIEHNVRITDEMAEKMTPPKPAKDASAAEKRKRSDLLKKLGACCKKQGSYHLATKKYTQAGDKLEAMKCLLLSGDTEKIIFFAGVSHSREIYVLAANYLQNLEWHDDAEIMKAIVSFYNKARAHDKLSSFYDACAAVEIDEFRNYEKALNALQEAITYAGKIRTGDKESRVKQLQRRVQTVERFVQARKLIKTEPMEMVHICENLLEQHDLEGSIRAGDVFALLIEFYYSQRNMERAYELIERMRSRDIILSPFLDADVINAIYQGAGMAPPTRGGGGGGAGGDDSDGIDEDIDEDIDD